jgi:MFS family permease
MNTKKNGALFTILLIIFVDVLGFSVMIPLLPFYAESLGASPFVVGMLVSTYGLCSLIAGPILGDLSDRHGRKKVLLLSQIGTCIGFIILALSNTLWIVFLARIIDGITSGNITVAQAYVSDVTTAEERTRAMGLIGASFGLGFIFGPAISGGLIHFGHAAPIWASTFLSFLSILGTTFFLKQTKPKSFAPKIKGAHARLKKYFEILKSPALKEYFGLFLIFSIAFGLYMSGFAMYAERMLRWNGHPFGAREVGIVLSYVGIISLLIQVFLMKILIKNIGEVKMMLLGFIATTSAFLVIGFAPLLAIFLMGITMSAFGNSILRPSIAGLISQRASPDQQGLVFGINQTLMSTAQIICPLVSGFLIEMKLTFFWCLLISGFSCVGIFLGRRSLLAFKPHRQTT